MCWLFFSSERNVLHLDLNAIPTVACLPNGLSADGELEVGKAPAPGCGVGLRDLVFD